MSVNKSYLPPKDSEEAKKLVAYYETCSSDEINRLAEEYGFRNRNSFVTAMGRVLGGRRGNAQVNNVALKRPQPKILLPPIEIKEYKPAKRGKGDPETAALNLSDHHEGEITPTYNEKVAGQRVDNLFKSTMHIVELHRNMYPINDLVINVLGDMVHGENPRQGAKIGRIQKGAQEQVFDLALPRLLSLILSFKQNFRSVTLHCRRGNHGRYSLYASDTSNWDMMLYKALKGVLKQHDIEVNISDEFGDIVNIQGFRFFTFHGDQVRATQGIPYFALIRKIRSWYSTFNGFNYAICAHWHKDDFFRVDSKIKAFINGSMVSDDPFTLEIIGTSTIPSQWLFGVHERKGVSWAYSLITDNKFLPEKPNPVSG